jgi:hypothetical protein
MSRGSTPTFELRLADYFRQRLQELSEQLVPQPHQDTLWYTGSVLARFGHSRQLFSEAEGELSIRPLALLYQDAHETRDPRHRCLIMRQLGDMALFLGALFPEKYAKRGILKDYFVGMGGSAYDYLAEHAANNRHIFSELASSFTRMLELVAQACSRQTSFNSSDVLSLYQRWRETGSSRIADQLQALGFDVSDRETLH